MLATLVHALGLLSGHDGPRWRGQSERFQELAEPICRHYRGREAGRPPDGLRRRMFDGPVRALRCAMALREAAAGVGIPLRTAGVQTGRSNSDRATGVRGLAVHDRGPHRRHRASGGNPASRRSSRTWSRIPPCGSGSPANGCPTPPKRPRVLSSCARAAYPHSGAPAAWLANSVRERRRFSLASRAWPDERRASRRSPRFERTHGQAPRRQHLAQA